MTKTYTISTKIWLWQGKGAWHFVTIPKETADDISYYFDHVKAGFGSIKVTAIIGNTTWKTSIFPDKKSQGYLLPIKKSVREQENIKEGDTITIELLIES